MVILMQSNYVDWFQLHIFYVSHFICDNYIWNVKNNKMILNSTHLLSNNVLVINLGYWRLRSNAQESDSYCKPTSICPFTSHTLVHSDYVQTKSMSIILLVGDIKGYDRGEIHSSFSRKLQIFWQINKNWFTVPPLRSQGSKFK